MARQKPALQSGEQAPYLPRRASREDYVAAAANLRRLLEPFGEENNGYAGPVSVLLHGSFRKGSYTPGTSDIDLVVMLPQGVITDKNLLLDLSDTIKTALNGSAVPLQIICLDERTATDGRFSTLTKDWQRYLPKEAELIVGPDPLPRMTYLDGKPDAMQALARKLSKCRAGLLLSAHNRAADPRRFYDDWHKSLKRATTAPKLLHYLIDNALVPEKDNLQRLTRSHFPRVDTLPLKRALGVLANPGTLDNAAQGRQALVYWTESLTFFEESVNAYLNKYLC